MLHVGLIRAESGKHVRSYRWKVDAVSALGCGEAKELNYLPLVGLQKLVRQD